MMRADPDIIMVGEIRDRETAQIAIESALTGHLVLSTLHTNDAPTAITRLIEMGIEPFLVASAIDCVVAQRLARTLCPTCKEPHDHPRAACCATSGFHAAFDLEAYEPVGLRALRRHRLQGPHRPLRGDGRHRGDPQARARARACRRDRRRWPCGRACDAARGRPREGPAGPHVHRRGRAGDGIRRICRLTNDEGADHMNFDFADVLLEVLERRASDLHLTAGAPPMVRVRGRLLGARGLPDADAHGHPRDRLLDPLQRPAPAAGDRLADRLRLPDPGPGPLPRQRLLPAHRVGAAFRLIPVEITPIEELGLPPIVHELRAEAARLRARHRPDRLGQVDLARRR